MTYPHLIYSMQEFNRNPSFADNVDPSDDGNEELVEGTG